MAARVGAWAASTLVALAWPFTAAAVEWSEGDFRLRIDSLLSVGVSLRTEDRDCRQIATVNGGCNPFASPAGLAAGDSDALTVEGTLLNGDDGNLNWDQWDAFSVLVKGTHDVEAQWRNYAAFVRLNWFGDPIQGQDDATERTPLSDSARFRDDVLEGGVVGAHFRLLDAYLDGNWSFAGRFFNARVGNQVINWGESLFQQGGLNSINTLDVTKVRLPGSELKEALLPAPIVKVGGAIVANLGFELYYQFAWRRFEIDPVGSFFSTSDLVSRGAQGQFQPLPDQLVFAIAPGCGDPGPSVNRQPSVVCPSDPTLRNLTSFPNGVPFLGFRDADDQGQFGAALRYYADAIETEVGLHYIRLHHKFPVVSHSGEDTTLGGCLAFNDGPNGPLPPRPGCDLGYHVIFPEDVDLLGFSFNTELGGIAFGGELSYRWDQPQPVTFDNDLCNSGNPGACIPGSPQRLASVGTLLQSVGVDPRGTGVLEDCDAAATGAGCGGGVVPGFTRLDRIVGVINGLWVFSSGTPYVGPIPRILGANDMTAIVEFGVTHFPDLDQCPVGGVAPGCKRYPTPSGVSEVDDTGWGYTIRLSATYDRVFRSPVTFLPTVSFSHNVSGITPPNEAGFNEDVLGLGISTEFRYLERWSAILSYSNSFGAGIRNGGNDRDFLAATLTFQF